MCMRICMQMCMYMCFVCTGPCVCVSFVFLRGRLCSYINTNAVHHQDMSLVADVAPRNNAVQAANQAALFSQGPPGWQQPPPPPCIGYNPQQPPPYGWVPQNATHPSYLYPGPPHPGNYQNQGFRGPPPGHPGSHPVSRALPPGMTPYRCDSCGPAGCRPTSCPNAERGGYTEQPGGCGVRGCGGSCRPGCMNSSCTGVRSNR